MPTQILFLPTALLDRLADGQDDAFDDTLRRHDLTVVAGALQRWNGRRHLFIAPRSAVTQSRRPSDALPGILLTDNTHPDCRAWLAPIDAAERRRQIAAVQAAVAASAVLSAHDRLDLTDCLDRALEAPMAMPAPPAPTLRPLRRDGAALRQLGTALDADLAIFDQALADYTDVQRDTDPLLVDLGWWAELGAALRPTGRWLDGDPVIAADAGRRRGGTAAVQQSGLNAVLASACLRGRVRPSVPFRDSSADPALVQDVHRLALRELVEHARWGTWRSRSVLIRDPAQNRTVDIGAMPEAIARRMTAWGHRFHRHRWAAHHPLLRSGLAHFEFVRVHPFADGNGRVGRLLIDGMHAEHGLPPLPLAAVFEAQRDAYLTAVRVAAATGDPEPYLRWHVRAATAAIDHLAATGARCAALRDRIRQAIEGLDIAPAAADRLTRSFLRLPACATGQRAIYARTSAVIARAACDRLARAGLGARVRLAQATLFIVPEALALARAGA